MDNELKVNRLNILMLITEMGIGGAEKVFFDHVKAFSAVHHVIPCVYTTKGFDRNFQTEHAWEELDDREVGGGSMGRLLYRRKRLEQLVAKHQIDVCISHMEGPSILNGISRLGNCKKIICLHGSIMGDSGKSAVKKEILNRVLLPLIYAKADAAVAVSRAMGEELKQIGLREDKVYSIPNFFDLEEIQQLSTAPVDPYESVMKANPVLVHVGRLSLQKNQKVLLDILATLKKEGRPEKLFIVGEGERKEELVAQGRAGGLAVFVEGQSAANLPYDVYFLGRQDNPHRFVARARLFLLTSFFEGFPLALGESLACATPAVSVDCLTGPSELLRSGNEDTREPVKEPTLVHCGILMPNWYTENLREEQLSLWTSAITALLDDSELCSTLKENCLKKIYEYRRENIINHWLNLIGSI